MIPLLWIDRAVDYVRTQKRPPLLVLEDDERRAFLERFGTGQRLRAAELAARDLSRRNLPLRPGGR